LFLSRPHWATLANAFSLFRLLSAPYVAFFILQQRWVAASILFFFAAISDALDGYCARRFNQQTSLGLYLDPLADKALLLASVGALVWGQVPSVLIPSWFWWILVGREVGIVGGGLVFMSLYKIPVERVPSNWWGKVTTVAIMLLVAWVLVSIFTGWRAHKSFMCFLFFVSALVVISFIQYCARAFTMQRGSG
jgi:cardiolipin synthase